MSIIRPKDVDLPMAFLYIALIAAAILVLLAVVFRWARPACLSFSPFVVIFGVAGYFSGGDLATAVLSKTQDTLTIMHNKVTETYPLYLIQRSLIQSDGNSSRLIFVLDNGQIVPMEGGVW
jgi:hypothetical protein